MSVKTHINNIKEMDNSELSHFARQIHDETFHNYYADEEELSPADMETFMKEMVREMMRRNLLIPRGGSGWNLMEMAESLAGESEFGEKYSEKGLE